MDNEDFNFDWEGLECDILRPILREVLENTFEPYGIKFEGDQEIEGNTFEELDANLWAKFDELSDKVLDKQWYSIDEDEDSVLDARLDARDDARMDEWLNRGRLRPANGGRYAPRKFNNKNQGLGSRRHQDIKNLVCTNTDHFFGPQGLDFNSLPNEYIYLSTGLPAVVFHDLVGKCIQSGRFPRDGKDVPAAERKKGECGKGIPIPMSKKVFLVLAMLKADKENTQFSFSNSGVAKKTMDNFYRIFVGFVSEELYAEEVYVNNELLFGMESIYSLLGYPGACSSIDGTIFAWGNCPRNLRAECIGPSKNVYTLNIQAAVGPNMRILHLGRLHGGRHNDLELYAVDELIKHIETDDGCKEFTYHWQNLEGELIEQKGLYVITDAIYRYDLCLCGFRYYDAGEAGRRQRIFNTHHAMVRKDVERTFGCLKQKFMVLSHPFPFRKVDTIEQTIRTCAYLWNVVLKHNGRYELGSNIDHYKVLNAEEDEEFPLEQNAPRPQDMVVRYDNVLEGYQRHRRRQQLACNHFFQCHVVQGNILWLREAQDVFPQRL